MVFNRSSVTVDLLVAVLAQAYTVIKAQCQFWHKPLRDLMVCDSCSRIEWFSTAFAYIVSSLFYELIPSSTVDLLDIRRHPVTVVADRRYVWATKLICKLCALTVITRLSPHQERSAV